MTTGGYVGKEVSSKGQETQKEKKGGRLFGECSGRSQKTVKQLRKGSDRTGKQKKTLKK